MFQTGELIITADAQHGREVQPERRRADRLPDGAPSACGADSPGEAIGVMQSLEQRHGHHAEDLDLSRRDDEPAAIVLQSCNMSSDREDPPQGDGFLELVSDINSSSICILQRVPRDHQDAERREATIFLHDPKTGTLFSRVSAGSAISEIRFPSHLGIAGAVFTSGESMNIPYAYADLRFNPSFDRQTGFFTRSILCVPIVNKDGRVIGVTQMLNKKGGVFTDEDEQRSRLHRADRHRAREFEAVRRRAADEGLCRQHAAEYVERRHHARPAGQGRHLQRLGRAHLGVRARLARRRAARKTPRREQRLGP
jgi:hypothetical protein